MSIFIDICKYFVNLVVFSNLGIRLGSVSGHRCTTVDRYIQHVQNLEDKEKFKPSEASNSKRWSLQEQINQ